MAEHAGTQVSNSALTNTRTTKAGWLARAFVAPIRVNYHMEHHLMAAVPFFKLPKCIRCYENVAMFQSRQLMRKLFICCLIVKPINTH